MGGGVDLSQRFILDDKAKTKISFNRYSVNALFSATGHTPLGAIGLSLGPSLGLYQVSHPRIDGQAHLSGEISIGVHYTFFLTETVMVRIRGNTIEPGGPIGQRVFRKFTDAALMIGYLIPTLQKLPTELLTEQ